MRASDWWHERRALAFCRLVGTLQELFFWQFNFASGISSRTSAPGLFVVEQGFVGSMVVDSRDAGKPPTHFELCSLLAMWDKKGVVMNASVSDPKGAYFLTHTGLTRTELKRAHSGSGVGFLTSGFRIRVIFTCE